MTSKATLNAGQGVSGDAVRQRAKEIREAISRNDIENEVLWQEYCRIFPAGVIDGEDIAWATARADSRS